MFEKEQNQHERDCEHHLNTTPSVEAKPSYASEPKEMAYGKELQSTVRENPMLILCKNKYQQPFMVPVQSLLYFQYFTTTFLRSIVLSSGPASGMFSYRGTNTFNDNHLSKIIHSNVMERSVKDTSSEPHVVTMKLC
jgi:hypothetical protein